MMINEPIYTLEDIRKRKQEVKKELDKVERNISYQTDLLFQAEQAPKNAMQLWMNRFQHVITLADSIWAGYKLVRKFQQNPLFSRKKNNRR